MNQPSKKFRSRYIGSYTIIEKISSQAFKLDLPSTMKIRPVFHISLLKEFNSLSPKTEIPNNFPSSNDMIYGDDTFLSILSLITKLPHIRLLTLKAQHFYSKVKWEGYDSSGDFWKPYVNVKRTDYFEECFRKSDKFRLLVLSNE